MVVRLFSTGSPTLMVADNSVSETVNSGVLIQSRDTVTSRIDVLNNTVSNYSSAVDQGIWLSTLNLPTANVRVAGNTVNNSLSASTSVRGIYLNNTSENGNFNYIIDNNTVTNSAGDGIVITNTGTGTFSGRISNNTGFAGNGSNGDLVLFKSGTGSYCSLVEANDFSTSNHPANNIRSFGSIDYEDTVIPSGAPDFISLITAKSNILSASGVTADPTYNIVSSGTCAIVNEGPIISSISDRVVSSGSSLNGIAFTASDLVDGPLSSGNITLKSSHQNLIPDGNLTLNGSPGSFNISISTTGFGVGEVTITVSAVDSGNIVSYKSFKVTIN